MKTKIILILLAAGLLVGCDQVPASNVVLSKEYLPLFPGICEFGYIHGGTYRTFQDSCKFFSVGDSLTFEMKGR